MKKNLIKAAKWLLLGIVCGILTVVFYLTERNSGSRYHLTVGSGLIAILCLAAVIWSLLGKMNDRAGVMVIEDIFDMRSGGCVVVGQVRGAFYVSEKVMIHSRDGTKIKTKIRDIEIHSQKARTAVNTPAALYFPDVEPYRIHQGDAVRVLE